MCGGGGVSGGGVRHKSELVNLITLLSYFMHTLPCPCTSALFVFISGTDLKCVHHLRRLVFLVLFCVGL